MSENPERNNAINSRFYDHLLATATMREKTQITFFSKNKTINTILDIIIGMYIEKGVEYLCTQNEQVIRLDYLISVGEERAFEGDIPKGLKFGNCGINPEDDPCGDAIEY